MEYDGENANPTIFLCNPGYDHALASTFAQKGKNLGVIGDQSRARYYILEWQPWLY